MSNTIRDFVFEQPLFDDHEHLMPVPELERDADTYRSFVGYAGADLEVAAGIQTFGEPKFPDENSDRLESDAAFFATWRKTRNTGYCRAIERACQALLGVSFEEQNADAIGNELKELKGSDAAAFLTEILHNKAAIRWAIKDSINTPEQTRDDLYPLFIRVNYRDDQLLSVINRDVITEREQRWDRGIYSLDELIDGMMVSITNCIETNKVTAFKIGLAYSRDLDFGYPSKADAERAFNRMMYITKGEKVLRQTERVGISASHAISQPSPAELRPLHDYLTHRYVQRASDEGLPIQIHTGYLAGIYQDLRNIDPMQLVPLLLRYRNTLFDLFHAGWPYTDVLGTIGKNFPNVFISLCWAWAMNPITMERTLDAWLDGVPYTKILGFGGDTGHPVAAYGYAMQAREGIARVFDRRVKRGDMDMSLAKDAAWAILYTNGCDLHRLST